MKPDSRDRTWKGPCLAATLLFLVCAGPASAQELEPRRWSPLPTDVHFIGVFYAFTDADIFFDPVLGLEDVTLDLHTAGAKVIRTIELFDRSARFEFMVPYQDARWEGLLQGKPALRETQGLSDPRARFAVNLTGSPALKRKEFGAYRAAHPVETVVGAGFTVQAPLGEYYEERLLNLGENRFMLRPELGVEHNHNKWSEEITGNVNFFTDNEEFFNGSLREQEPVYSAQGHVNYTFRPGLWVGGGILYLFGGESKINGVDKDDPRANVVTGISLGLPVNRAVGVKLSYLRSETREDTGSDSDTVAAGVSILW